MGFFTLMGWDTFSKDNDALKKYFGTAVASENFSLVFRDGFFLCPDDNINRSNSLKHLCTETSIVELFGRKYPKIYSDVMAFYNLTDKFDRLDYIKFKNGAKLAYFFAIANYVHVNKLTDLTDINAMYKGTSQTDIENNLLHNIQGFILLANNEKVTIKLFGLYKFALKLIVETVKGISMPPEFKTLTTFLQSPKYYPYSNIIGAAFEQEIQQIFEDSVHKETYVSTMIKNSTGEEGILIPLDNDAEFKNYAAKKAKGVNIPDYLYVTRSKILPFDLKVNLSFARPEQVSKDNAKALFIATQEKMGLIFKGFKIEDIPLN